MVVRTLSAHWRTSPSIRSTSNPLKTLAPPGGLEPPAYGLGNCSRGHEDAPGGPRGHPGWQSFAKRVLAGPRRSYKRSHSSSAREGCARSTGGPRPRSRRGHRVPRGRGTAPSVRASSRLTRGGWCFRKGQGRPDALGGFLPKPVLSPSLLRVSAISRASSDVIRPVFFQERSPRFASL